MEAASVDTLPTGGDWQYEPKWDGFRCLAFKDAADVHLRSKSGQPFERYFPEIVAAVTKALESVAVGLLDEHVRHRAAGLEPRPRIGVCAYARARR